MARLNTSTIAVLLMLMAVLVTVGIRIVQFPTVAEFNHLIYDDGFYYLKAALNVWREGKTSFGGVLHTNGYHPLWMGLLVLLAWPWRNADFESLQSLLLAMEWLSLACALAASVIFWRVFRQLGAQPMVAAFFSALLVCVQTPFILSGLEAPILLVALAGFAWAWVQPDRDQKIWRLALAGALLGYARLDYLLLPLIAYAWLMVKGKWRAAGIALGLTALMVAPYLAYQQVVHGSVTPISGQVKAFWNDAQEWEQEGQAYRLYEPSYWFSEIFDDRLKHWLVQDNGLLRLPMWAQFSGVGWIPLPLWLLWLVGALLTGGVVWRVYRSEQRQRLLAPAILLGLGVAGGWGITLYHALASHGVWPWYAVLSLICLTLIPAIGVIYILPERWRRHAAVAGLVWLMGWNGVQQWGQNARETYSGNPLHTTYLRIGEWLRKKTPEDAIVGSWAAGNVGWYAGQRAVINLEGLMGDAELLEANRSQQLMAWLVEHKVEYLANFWRKDAPRPEVILEKDAQLLAFDWVHPSYFWGLRVRPILDCPRAFSVAYRYLAKDPLDTQGYVLAIDRKTLEGCVAAKEEWAAHMARYGVVIEAESPTHITAGHVQGEVGRASGWYLEGGRDIVYMDAPLPESGEYRLIGRMARLQGRQAPRAIPVQIAGNDRNVALSAIPSGRWQWLDLGKVRMQPRALIRFPKWPESLILDQLYLVPETQAGAFLAEPADWYRQ